MKFKKITPQIAAMYLGQKCTCKWIDSGDSADFPISTLTLNDLSYDLVEITPHLRSLESITEEEAIHIHDEVMGFPYAGIRPCIEWICLSFPGSSSFYQDAIGYSAVWLKLLEWGFDLFYLIPQNLAKPIK